MSKYRLCYLNMGRYEDIKLEKLGYLKERNTTDIETIDVFTTNFRDLNELLEFLKKNNLVPLYTNRLYITIDSKNTFKKIYNGDKLLFSTDKEYLKISYIYKFIMDNLKNQKLMVNIAKNYIEKYQNAYNRATGASYILSLFSTLGTLAKNSNNINMEASEFDDFYKCVNEFIDLEFYKIDKKKFQETRRLEKKKDKEGKYIKQYRNIHDFIIFLKTLGIEFKEIKNINKDKIEYEKEEFLTSEDYERTNKILVEAYTPSKFEPYKDGNDYIVPLSKRELKKTLDEEVKKLYKK